MNKSSEDKKLQTGFNSPSSFGKWVFTVYDGDPPMATTGHLFVDNNKYYILDSNFNLQVCVPSGNVACVVNILDKE